MEFRFDFVTTQRWFQRSREFIFTSGKSYSECRSKPRDLNRARLWLSGFWNVAKQPDKVLIWRGKQWRPRPFVKINETNYPTKFLTLRDFRSFAESFFFLSKSVLSHHRHASFFRGKKFKAIQGAALYILRMKRLERSLIKFSKSSIKSISLERYLILRKT